MKKIIKIVIFTLAFFVFSKDSYAKEIIVGDEIPNIKVHLKFANIDENRSIYELIDKDNKELLYNISPEVIDYNVFFATYDFYGGLNKIPFNIQESIARLAYFGFGYKDRVDKKWYAITQYLIWEKLIEDKGGEIYFVDEHNNRVLQFQDEIKAIKQDISDFEIIPSFTSKEYKAHKITLNDKLVFEDTNKVLDTYDIESGTPDFTYEVKDNTMTITPIAPNANYIAFWKKIENKNNNLVYNAYDKSILLSRGRIKQTVSFLYINARMPKIVFKTTPLNNILLDNQKFEMHMEDGSMWGEITFNEQGLSNEIDLYPGKYYLINTSTPYGYKTIERINIEVKKDDITYDIPNELITKNITLEYRIISDDKYMIGDNKDIEIYNNERLVKKVKTNEEGFASFSLSYGEYEIKRKDSEDSLKVTIDENYEESKPLIFTEKENIIINEELDDNNNFETPNDKDNLIVSEKGSIIINKIDSKTGMALANIRYALFNKNHDLIATDSTDINGKIIFKDLDTGTYYLKEILNDEDYSLGEDYYEVEVKSDINTILTNKVHTAIEVPNTLKEYNNSYLVLILLISLYGFKKLKKVL